MVESLGITDHNPVSKPLPPLSMPAVLLFTGWIVNGHHASLWVGAQQTALKMKFKWITALN